MSILEQLPVSSRPHWQLYSDWCDSRGLSPAPATLEQLAAYLHDVPAAVTTSVARIRAIRIVHGLLGIPFPLPLLAQRLAVRTGAEWASVERAMSAMPVTRYPVGLVGRRDAFVLLLLDRLQLSRRRARTVSIGDIDVDEWTIDGAQLQRLRPATTCDRCVLSRWLRVLGPAALGMRFSVAELLDPDRYDDEHDCEVPLDDGWTTAPTLLPAIDQHGWLDNHQPLSTRSISAITARRQDPTVEPADNYPRIRPSSEVPAMSLREVADAYDDLDERVTALLLLTRDLVTEMDTPPGRPPAEAHQHRSDHFEPGDNT